MLHGPIKAKLGEQASRFNATSAASGVIFAPIAQTKAKTKAKMRSAKSQLRERAKVRTPSAMLAADLVV